MSEDRNPEPPTELLQSGEDVIKADNIGDTVYSKHWLFTTLMKLIQVVDQPTPEGADSEAVLELDDDLQNELCQLWDMSMNRDVAGILMEFKAADILTEVISRSKAPRATEICVGILGNMACNQDICETLTAHSRFMKLILLLLETDDTPTLVEATRLLYTCLSHDNVRPLWLKAMKDNKSEDSLNFILQSSTNDDLLKNTVEVIDKAMDSDDELCTVWSQGSMVASLLEANTQLGQKNNTALDTFLHIFQLVSTTEPGVEALVSASDRVVKVLQQYLEKLCDSDVVLVEGEEGSLASAFSVLACLLQSCNKTASLLMEEKGLIRCTLKILAVIHPKLHKDQMYQLSRQRSRTTSGGSPLNQSLCDSFNSTHSNEQSCQSNDIDQSTLAVAHASTSREETKHIRPEQREEDTDAPDLNSKEAQVAPVGNDGAEVCEDNKELLMLLFDTIQGLLIGLVTMLKQAQEEEAPTVLVYLEDCLRQRVLCMAHTLHLVDQRDSNNNVQDLVSLAKTYKLSRLQRLLQEVSAHW